MNTWSNDERQSAFKTDDRRERPRRYRQNRTSRGLKSTGCEENVERALPHADVRDNPGRTTTLSEGRGALRISTPANFVRVSLGTNSHCLL